MAEQLSLASIHELVEKSLEAISYPENPKNLFKPIAYALQSGGKRIRPILLIGAYNWMDQYAPVEDLLPVATAVEVFHNFTLVHDDIMDNSSLRRGKSTVWAKWGANNAILSGDAMTIMAYELLCKAPQKLLPGILQRFNQLAMGVCMGQQWDMDFETKHDVTMPDYITMVEYKTAELIVWSIAIGVFAAGADQKLENLLKSSAKQMGVAFQLQDDWLDVYGKTEVFGKQCGDDIMDNKQTYLSVLARELANDTQLSALKRYAELKEREEKVTRVLEVYEELGVYEKTIVEVERRLKLAEQDLAQAEEIVGNDFEVYRRILKELTGRTF